MKLQEIKAATEELLDGRTLVLSKIATWANRIRTGVAMNVVNSGFHGLYFLYKEATVIGGSEAGEGRYAIPDDFVDDLNVFYDKKMLSKTAPGQLNITQEIDKLGTPEWFELAGVEFSLRPIPAVAEKEILLFYNGLPDNVDANDEFTDYFMKRFPDLHIFGVGHRAALSVGQLRYAEMYKGLFEEERMALMVHNRRHYFKYARLRFQNWEEYQEQKRHVFPQFIQE